MLRGRGFVRGKSWLCSIGASPDENSPEKFESIVASGLRSMKSARGPWVSPSLSRAPGSFPRVAIIGGSPDATGRGLRLGGVSMLWGRGFAPGEVVAM